MPYIILKWLFHQKWLTKFRKTHDILMKGFEKHANKGYGDAQELYGFLLLHKGLNNQSKLAGVNYLTLCAEAARPKVCWQLYNLYKNGSLNGLNRDAEKAQQYLRWAQEGEHPLALELN